MATDQLTCHVNKKSFAAWVEMICGTSRVEASMVSFYIIISANQTFKCTDFDGLQIRDINQV